MNSFNFIVESSAGSTVSDIFSKCNTEAEKHAFIFSYSAFATLDKRSHLSGVNYIFVISRVVELLRIYGFSPEALSVAWIYKVFVYSPVNAISALSLFEPNIAEMVKCLSPANIFICPSKRARRSEERRNLAISSGDCKSIKCAELLINCSLMKMRSHSAADKYQSDNADLLLSLKGALPDLFDAVLTMMRTNTAVDNLLHYAKRT